MMNRLRSLLVTALVAIGLLTSGQAIALAKGASPATGFMVLCTGHGPVVLFTDADGNPTAAPHLCPDCTLAALTAIDAPNPAMCVSAATQTDLDRPAPAALLPSAHTPQACARAPPLLV